MATGDSEDTTKQYRGFRAMDPELHRKICSAGGKAAHAKKRAHEWDSTEAKAAGRKGGQISRGGRGRVLNDPQAHK